MRIRKNWPNFYFYSNHRDLPVTVKFSELFKLFDIFVPSTGEVTHREYFRPAPAAAVNQPHDNNVQSSQRIWEGLSKDRPSRYPEAPISNLASIKVKPREIKVLPKSTTVLGTYTFSPILRSRVHLLSPNLVHEVQLDSLEVRWEFKNYKIVKKLKTSNQKFWNLTILNFKILSFIIFESKIKIN